PGSTVKPDGDGAYVKASKEGYEHDRSVAMKEPEQTYEHLKWINTVTSNLKRYLLSTHHGVFPKYRKRSWLNLPTDLTQVLALSSLRQTALCVHPCPPRSFTCTTYLIRG
ncbi:MAG: transposase, partial [Rhodospirillales bacterium]|nr:transposase [Rhodospirillales bacterium]